MGSAYFTNPLVFLIDTLLGIYILLVMLRFLLQWVRADFYNPVSQFVVKATNPPLRVLRRFIPGWGGIDVAAIVLMLLLQLLALWLVTLLSGLQLNIIGLIVLAISELVSLLLWVYIFAIIIQVVLSWVSPGGYNPAAAIIYSLTEPLMQPARRMLPPVSGLDLSPMIVLLALYLLRMLLLPPLQTLAASLG